MASTKKPVSKFSATQIGTVDPSNDRHREAREVYKREAHDISQALEANHHSRRLKNMQVYYPDTITKLSHSHDQQKTKAPPPQQQQQQIIQSHRSQSSKFTIICFDLFILLTHIICCPAIMREQEFTKTKSQQTHKEHDFNNRKLMYNKECGRVAQVRNIICGEASSTKEMLFPQGATHQQILALTHSDAAPDAHKMPPAVQRPKKWLGDDLGWGK
jgi:hypothetical protein